MVKLRKSPYSFFSFLILIGFAFLVGFNTYAQKRCNTVEAERIRREKYKFLPSEIEFENWVTQRIKERKNKPVPFGTTGTGEMTKIAVVVHVIYNEGEAYGEGANITDEQIYSQIEVLNEDYQRKNADTINTQPEFLQRASRMNIEFVLARQTINGDPTTGITRDQGPKTSYNPLSIADRELLSSISDWDPSIYLNIWVTNLSNSYIGLAQFPDYSFPGLDSEPNRDNEATDGLVIDYLAFGSITKVPGLNLMSAYNLGRTTTHEMGHFFGLKHVWGDNLTDCSVDDYVADTPVSNKDYSGQSTPIDHVSCSSNDMFENFLYYTNDKGMNAFTLDQIIRMETIIDNAPRRASLYNSIGTEYPDNLYFDLAINEIKSPGKVVCDEELNLVIEVKNNGTIPVTNFDVNYTIDNVDQAFSYTGDTIFTGETAEIPVEKSAIQNGNYKLTVTLGDIPDDINGSNNSKTHAFIVDKQTDFIPLREQFEVSDLNATNWISINDDDKIGWELTEAPLIGNQNTAAFMNFYNYEDRQQMDWLISPSLDFSGAYQASVTFKTSYAKNQNFNDQIRLVASKNCGADFNEVLAIYSSSELANSNATDYWTPANQSDWSTHSIDLGAYAGISNVRLAFVAVNDYGNNLYLDDIEFYTTAEENLVRTAQNSFTIYPNPSNDGLFNLVFNTSGRQVVNVFIYDQLGKLISMKKYTNTLNQTFYYDFSGIRSGVYLISAKGEDFVRTKKLLISR